MNKVDLKRLAAYEDDFALWSAEQAALIRAGKFERMDLENVAEEIESLGRSDKHQIQSRMTVILAHLLKWQVQPAGRSPSWESSVVIGRDEISGLIERSPSLGRVPGDDLDRAYRKAPRIASIDSGLPVEAFPRACPYTAAQVLDDDFWPEPSAE